MRRYNKRSILYAIGAGTLLLALMAFSAICLGVIHVCGRWFTWGIFSFWEILGISIASFLGFMYVRSRQRRKSERAAHESISRRLREAVEEKVAQTRRSDNWRNLYEQMSDEERLQMKAMMQKYCSDGSCRQGDIAPSPASGLPSDPTAQRPL